LSPTTLRPWIPIAHLLSLIFCTATGSAVSFQLPIIARKAFGADDWQTLIITSAGAVLLILSIFWGDVLRRTSLPRYLAIYWAMALLPLAGIAFADGIGVMISCFLLAACGGAAWPAAHGEIMKLLYPDRLRGRIYGFIVTFSTLAAAAGSYGLGKWLYADPEAFRVFLPIAAGAQAMGLVGLTLTLRAAGVLGDRKHDASLDERSIRERFIEPLTHTAEVLRTDKIFGRYEAAFMIYGAAWMICEALKPALMTDKLQLNYAQIGINAFMAFQIGVVACTFLAGVLMDKLGPARLCCLTFAIYPLYPIGLTLAQNEQHLLMASIIYGVCSAGVNAGWLLGPVTLAPTPAKVPQYVAIHATMVGLRGTVFQFLGVALYKMTGSFHVSFVIAALCFAWASWQMWALHKVMMARAATATPTPNPAPNPAPSSTSAPAPVPTPAPPRPTPAAGPAAK
jgi:MFS family permease